MLDDGTIPPDIAALLDVPDEEATVTVTVSWSEWFALGKAAARGAAAVVDDGTVRPRTIITALDRLLSAEGSGTDKLAVAAWRAQADQFLKQILDDRIEELKRRHEDS